MGWQSVSGEEGHMGDCKETIVEQIGAEEDGGFVLADEHTLGGFIDPHDVGQVKYEMVRAVALGELTTVEAARRFGYSRETVYNCMRALKRDGMWGLLPKKRGPKDGHKLDARAKDFVDDYLLAHPRIPGRGRQRWPMPWQTSGASASIPARSPATWPNAREVSVG